MPTPANFELPVINPRPRKPGTFGRGNPPPSNGRRPGQVNKITADLKQGIMGGAAAAGYDGAGLGGVDGFLLMCAQRYPKHYLALLGKLLPLNLNASVNNATINEVRIISVPADHYLSRADIERLQSPTTVEAQSIEHVPPEPIAPQQNEPECFQTPPAIEIVNELPAEPTPAVETSRQIQRAAPAGNQGINMNDLLRSIPKPKFPRGPSWG